MSSVAPIAVRKGAASDYSALLAIDQYASSHTERRAVIGDALATGECLIAESGGTPCGYAVLNYTFFGFGFIPVVVVSPPHRRRGVGLRLLREAQAQCMSQKTVYLHEPLERWCTVPLSKSRVRAKRTH